MKIRMALFLSIQFCRRVLISLILFTLLFLAHGMTGLALAENVYLDQVIQWNPGTVGKERFGWSDMVDENGVAIQNNNALGPPTGKGSYSSGPNNQALGINGSAVFRFEDGWYIFNGPGDDFVTFQCNFAWGGVCDNLCNELGHVEISEDGLTWYFNINEAYDINRDPNQNSGDYVYDHVRGVHGSQPTWANYQENIQAQHIVGGKWENIPDVYVSKDFLATDPYLGGTRFDLADFRSRLDNSAWPSRGKMRYIRITDDNTILDGQDYSKDWCLGTHINAAMGINVDEDAPPSDPPAVQTGNADSITTSSARLNATVNPNGSNTTCFFQYGLSTAYGSATSAQDVGQGTAAVPVCALTAGLAENTPYHFRIVAWNTAGTSYGTDQTFVTAQTISNTVYVIPPGDNGNCGGHAPCRSSIEAAVDYAMDVSPGEQVTINVASGTYTEGIDAINPQGKTVTLEGGWKSDFSGPAASQTIMKGGVKTTGGRFVVKRTIIRPYEPVQQRQ